MHILFTAVFKLYLVALLKQEVPEVLKNTYCSRLSMCIRSSFSSWCTISKIVRPHMPHYLQLSPYRLFVLLLPRQFQLQALQVVRDKEFQFERNNIKTFIIRRGRIKKGYNHLLDLVSVDLCQVWMLLSWLQQ